MQHILKSKQESNPFGKGSSKAQTGIFSVQEMDGQGRVPCSRALKLHIQHLFPWWAVLDVPGTDPPAQPWLEKAMSSLEAAATESLRLEKPFKVIMSKYQPSTTTLSTNPHPHVLHPQVF